MSSFFFSFSLLKIGVEVIVRRIYVGLLSIFLFVILLSYSFGLSRTNCSERYDEWVISDRLPLFHGSMSDWNVGEIICAVWAGSLLLISLPAHLIKVSYLIEELRAGYPERMRVGRRSAVVAVLDEEEEKEGEERMREREEDGKGERATVEEEGGKGTKGGGRGRDGGAVKREKGKEGREDTREEDELEENEETSTSQRTIEGEEGSRKRKNSVYGGKTYHAVSIIVEEEENEH